MNNLFEKIFELYDVDFEEEKQMLLQGKPRIANSILKKKRSILDEKGLFLLGTTYFLTQNYKEAVEIFLKNIQEKFIPIPLDLFYEIVGVGYFCQNMKLEAIKYFILSIEENPMNNNSKYNLANIYLESGNFQKAYEFFLELKEIEPKNENIINNLKYLESKL